MSGLLERVRWLGRLRDRTDLSSSEKLLMFALILRANDVGISWPSHGRLARDTSLSVRQVGSLLRQLDARGLIEVQRTAERTTNIYRVRSEALAEDRQPLPMLLETNGVVPRSEHRSRIDGNEQSPALGQLRNGDPEVSTAPPASGSSPLPIPSAVAADPLGNHCRHPSATIADKPIQENSIQKPNHRTGPSRGRAHARDGVRTEFGERVETERERKARMERQKAEVLAMFSDDEDEPIAAGGIR